MHIKGIYVGLPTASLDNAEQFYTHLFNRKPDASPMRGLIQWHDVAGANIQIFHDEAHAGSGRLTIVVSDMEEARQSLEELGVPLDGESHGDYGRIAQATDLDGNRLDRTAPPRAIAMTCPEADR